MTALKPITIVGGGVAGLSLGIALRRRNVPVTVWEAGHFPRHRVCGEFISGRGQETLNELGLGPSLLNAGARQATTVAFCAGRVKGRIRALPQPALCLSRYNMDAVLARCFVDLGGELREQSRWRERCDQEGVVQATGRHAVAAVAGNRWFGFKAHARNVSLRAHLEMHLERDGYVGLCRLNDTTANVCGLFRRRMEDSTAPSADWESALRGAPGTFLNDCMAGAVFDKRSVCAVAGLSLLPVKAGGRAECALGDALTMIPPITGNGMSMALEAAAMAVDFIAAYSQGEMAWAESKAAVARKVDERFARRLAWARLLQELAFRPVLRAISLCSLFSSETLWRWAFQRTRS